MYGWRAAPDVCRREMVLPRGCLKAGSVPARPQVRCYRREKINLFCRTEVVYALPGKTFDEDFMLVTDNWMEIKP